MIDYQFVTFDLLTYFYSDFTFMCRTIYCLVLSLSSNTYLWIVCEHFNRHVNFWPIDLIKFSAQRLNFPWKFSCLVVNDLWNLMKCAFPNSTILCGCFARQNEHDYWLAEMSYMYMVSLTKLHDQMHTLHAHVSLYCFILFCFAIYDFLMWYNKINCLAQGSFDKAGITLIITTVRWARCVIKLLCKKTNHSKLALRLVFTYWYHQSLF